MPSPADFPSHLTPLKPGITRPSSVAKSSKSSSIRSSTESTSSIPREKPKSKKKGYCTNPDLTEESLKEFNRVKDAEAKKNHESSPYYKVLNYSGSYLCRLKGGGASPGRESRGSTATSSTISTILFKIQAFGTSCFKRGGRYSMRNATENVTTAPKTVAPAIATPLLSPAVDSRKITGAMEIRPRRGGEIIQAVARNRSSIEGKPLRESFVRDPVKVSNAGKELPAPASNSSSGSTTTASKGVENEKKFSSGGGATTTTGEMENEKKLSNSSSDGGTTTTMEKKFVWADKYRPKVLKDFICNRDKAQFLQNLVAERHCGHFIFEGLPGVGKRTMVWALLKETFESENLTTREEYKDFHFKGEAVNRTKVKLKVSSRHVEFDIADLHGYERDIIVQLIEEADVTGPQCDHTNCRVIILYGADKLSADTQHYLRWVVERHNGCNKIIFCCYDASKLQPISSLCTLIQLVPPSNSEIVEVLDYIAKQECIELPHQLAVRIAENSQQNLRQGIRSFEASWQFNHELTEDQVILTGWEEDIATIAKNIIDEQSPKQLYIIRGKLQSLIEHNVSPDFIFSTLVGELKKHLDEGFWPKIDALYVEYNRSSGFLLDGSFVVVRKQEKSTKRNSDPRRRNLQNFMKIEEITAKFMSFYKSSVKSTTTKAGYPVFHESSESTACNDTLYM